MPILAQPPQRTAAQLIEEEFLPMRAKLLEVAASLDRIDAASSGNEAFAAPPPETPSASSDLPQRQRIEQAIAILVDGDGDRAARLQMLFSRPFQPDWRRTMQLD